MSPWDELRYFDLPKETNFTNAQPNTTPVAQANPNRILLAFANGLSGQTCTLSTKPGIVVGGGWVIGINSQAIILTARDHPSLVQSEWYAQILATATLTVIEVVLHDWPVRETE